MKAVENKLTKLIREHKVTSEEIKVYLDKLYYRLDMSERIKTLFKTYDFTQVEVAEIIGTKVQTLNGKINGRSEFVHSEILAIKRIFDLSAEELDYIFFKLN